MSRELISRLIYCKMKRIVLTKKRKRTTKFGSKKINYLDILIVVAISIVTILIIIDF